MDDMEGGILSGEFCAALEASPTAMLVVARDGLILFASRRAQSLFGGELAGTSIDELVPPDVASRHADLRGSYLADPEERRMGAGRDLLGRRLDGTLFPVEVGLNPFDKRDVRLTVCSIVDITERVALERDQKRAHSAAMEAQRLESLGHLAGGVAHDFNNLLVSILGNAKLALGSPALVNECLEDVIIASEHAADLARQMLAYSGRGQFRLQRLTLASLVDESRPLLRSLLRRRATLRIQHIDSFRPIIHGDEAQLKQVLVNLVGNAADAIGDGGGTIRVTTAQVEVDDDNLGYFQPGGLPKGTYAQLEIVDTGSGIAPDILSRIFEPFVTSKGAGHGLGLPAVLGIVRGHNGGVAVYSEPGNGTTFKLVFPMLEAQELPVPVPVTPRLRSQVCLVIDDDRLVRRFARRVLSAAGFRVLEAEDGLDGVELLKSSVDEIHVVLLDIYMPRMAGPEAFREIRKIAPDMPVILTSGFPKEETMVSFAGHRVSGYLPKPYTADQLLDLLDATVGE